MRALARRLEALEGKGDYLTIGELLDRLHAPVDDGRRPDPRVVAWLHGLPEE